MAGIFKRFMKSDNFWVSTFRDILFAGIAISAVALVLYMYSGAWPPLVSVDGLSMDPHMHSGDLILIQKIDPGKIATYDVAKGTDYKTFESYGDVLVYRPFGRTDITPVIHRAMAWVNESEPMWEGGIAAPSSGFVTQGDNNYLYDQCSGICPNTPVNPDWVMGVARFRIPLLGYVRGLLGLFGI
ncbi:MAG TPA: S26 family signal peptidase [Methanocella sp.]